MNLERSTYATVSSDSFSVRPRNRRLISYGDEDTSTARPPSSQTSPFSARDISPIPRAHPSRPLSTTANAGSVVGTGYDKSRGDRHESNASSGFGLWESWSSLQGIASTLLGGDDEQAKKGKRSAALNGPLSGKPTISSATWYPRPQWGPRSGPALKDLPGSKEERQAIVQAKRREALLLADVNECTDSGALYKRRDSDQTLSNAAISSEQNDDALVYVHRVKPQDTLAGVMIRYQCQPAVFRRVNRLWPNDNIQIRQHVFLPVEACAVRGRKIDAEVRLKQEPCIRSVPEESESKLSSHDGSQKANTPPFPSINSIPNPDPEYKHEFFVSIPGIPEDVEIARISRRTLGFFPPSRRKSQTLSDTDILSSSPKTSIDLNPRLQSLSLNASPCRNRPKKPHRSGSGFSFVDHLKGPGGVGTLRGSGPAGAVQPGPSEDSLNKMFAHRLPNMAPRQSFDSVHSTSSSTTGLENVGGVIEGWVRKMGTRLAGSLESGDAYRQQQAKLGDLIELESSGDTVDGEQDDIVVDGPVAQKRGRVSAAVDGPESSTGGRTSSRELFRGKAIAGVVTATEEALLRERFPPRGRVVDSQTNKRR